MTRSTCWLNPLILFVLLLAPIFGIGCSEGSGGGGTPTVTCANFNQQNVDFLQCSFDEATEVCDFYIQFFADTSVDKTCREHCEGVVGGTCLGAEEEVSKEGDGRCQGSGSKVGCDAPLNTVICSCTLEAGAGGSGGTGGTGGSGGGSGTSCSDRIAFDLICPGDVAIGTTGQVTVQGYTAANINQLSFGVAGGGTIDPLAFQVPDPADATTNIPAAPYVFTFTGLLEGDIILTMATFDLSEASCSVSKACNFNVVP